MLFPSICDVIRNLSGMWKMMFPRFSSHYFDVPQNYRDDIGGNFYVNEMAELRRDLAELARQADHRRRASPLDCGLQLRIGIWCVSFTTSARNVPWQAPAAEVYLMVRAGLVLCRSKNTRSCCAAISPRSRSEERPRRDNCRVVLTGVFCEQPPLNLIKSLGAGRLLRRR